MGADAAAIQHVKQRAQGNQSQKNGLDQADRRFAHGLFDYVKNGLARKAAHRRAQCQQRSLTQLHQALFALLVDRDHAHRQHAQPRQEAQRADRQHPQRIDHGLDNHPAANAAYPADSRGKQTDNKNQRIQHVSSPLNAFYVPAKASYTARTAPCSSSCATRAHRYMESGG